MSLVVTKSMARLTFSGWISFPSLVFLAYRCTPLKRMLTFSKQTLWCPCNILEIHDMSDRWNSQNKSPNHFDREPTANKLNRSMCINKWVLVHFPLAKPLIHNKCHLVSHHFRLFTPHLNSTNSINTTFFMLLECSTVLPINK